MIESNQPVQLSDRMNVIHHISHIIVPTTVYYLLTFGYNSHIIIFKGLYKTGLFLQNRLTFDQGH